MEMLLPISFVILALAERRPGLRFEASALLRRGLGTDLVCFLTGGVLLGLAVRAVIAPWTGTVGLQLAAVPTPITVIVAVVLYDLGGYLTHESLHRFDALWALHKIHHSSPVLDWAATFRAHFLEHGLRHLASSASLLLLGFPVQVVGGVAILYTAWAALNHSNLRLDLRAIEWLLVTPRLHRLHHVPGTSRGNLGTIFSFWDRARGALVTDSGAALAPVGIPGNGGRYPDTWLALQLEPFRQAARSSRGAD